MKKRSGIPAKSLDFIWSCIVAIIGWAILKEPILYLDVGARGGVGRRWRFLGAVGKAKVVMVEPHPQEAARLTAKYPGMTTICAALGEMEYEKAELKVTRQPGLSSLLEPAIAELPEQLQHKYQVVDRIPITLRRLDSIWDERLGGPTFVKVDVQGSELAVLRGLGELLDSLIGVEAEVRIPKHYEGQPTIEDINRFMTSNGFDLVKLVPNGFKEGKYLAVFNAYFLRRSMRQGRVGRYWRLVNRIQSNKQFLRWNF